MFKFEIGQIVTTKAGIEGARRNCAIGYPHCPVLATIIQRQSVECPGGTQHEYMLACDGKRVMANEIELALPDEFDYAAEHAKADAVESEREFRQRAARMRWQLDDIKAKTEGQ